MKAVNGEGGGGSDHSGQMQLKRHKLKLDGPLFNPIDLLAILQKSLDRAIFLYNFIREVRSSGVRASIAIVHIRKFYRM